LFASSPWAQHGVVLLEAAPRFREVAPGVKGQGRRQITVMQNIPVWTFIALCGSACTGWNLFGSQFSYHPMLRMLKVSKMLWSIVVCMKCMWLFSFRISPCLNLQQNKIDGCKQWPQGSKRWAEQKKNQFADKLAALNAGTKAAFKQLQRQVEEQEKAKKINDETMALRLKTLTTTVQELKTGMQSILEQLKQQNKNNPPAAHPRAAKPPAKPSRKNRKKKVVNRWGCFLLCFCHSLPFPFQFLLPLLCLFRPSMMRSGPPHRFRQQTSTLELWRGSEKPARACKAFGWWISWPTRRCCNKVAASPSVCAMLR
jgi:hypothetical protein